MELSDEIVNVRGNTGIELLSDPEGLSIGDGEWNRSGVVETSKASLTERLNLNIVSIVLGALFFIVAATWVDTLRVVCNGVINDDEEDRYFLFNRKIWATIFVTLLAVFFAIILYGWYKTKVDFIW